MAAEYSYVPLQTVVDDENILFLDGEKACRKGCITHRSGSGGTVGAISVAIQEDGETLGNAVATVTPAAVGEFFNVSLSTFITIPCECCVIVSVENISVDTAIDVTNANIIFERIA